MQKEALFLLTKCMRRSILAVSPLATVQSGADRKTDRMFVGIDSVSVCESHIDRLSIRVA